MFSAVRLFQLPFLCLFGAFVLLGHVLYALPQETLSRQIKENHYSLDRFLPGEEIRQLYQDSRGVFWVLTDSGLYNFDGNYIYTVLKAVAVPSAIVGADARGWVWLAYGEGAQRSWSAVNQFTRQPIPEADRWPGVKDEVVDLWVEGETLLLRTETDELWRWVKGKWKLVTRGLPANCRIAGLTSEDMVWLQYELTEGGKIPALLRVNLYNGRQQRFNVDRPYTLQVAGKDLLLLSDNSWGLLNAYGKVVWSDLSGLIPGFKAAVDSWNPQYEVVLYREARDELWISFQNTLYICSVRNAAQQPLAREKPLFARRSLFAGNGGSVLLVEPSGFSQLLSYTGYFQKIAWHDPYRHSPETLQEVTAVLETPKGILYFAAGQAIYRREAGADKSERIVETGRVAAMVWDGDRQCIWAIGADQLFRIDGRSQRAELFSLPERGLGAEASLLLQGEWLWMGGAAGVYRFDIGNRQFLSFEDYQGYSELTDARVYGFFRASENDYWILSDKGIYGLNPEKGIQWEWHAIDDTAVNAAMAAVRQVWKDPAAEGYWMATAGGLLYWDKNRDAYRLFAEPEALPATDLRSVYAIGDELWIGSDRGLIVFDRRDQQSRYYTVDDGLSDNYIVPGAHTQGLDGTLYMGTRNGLTAFRPDALSAAAMEQGEGLSLSLMSALVYSPNTGNREALLRFYEQGAITLGAEDVAMEMYFALPPSPGRKRIYMSYMEREEDGWIPFPGYALKISPATRKDTLIKVKAQVQGSASEETIFTIPLRFEPTNPLKRWLFALLLLLLLSLLWFFGRLPRMQVANVGGAMVAAPEPGVADLPVPETPSDALRFFRSMAHELRVPLSLILGPVQHLGASGRWGKQEYDMLETIKHNADLLLHQVDELLLAGALEEGKLPDRPEFFDPGTWFRERLNGFDTLAMKKRIYLHTHFSWNYSDELYHHKDWLTIIVNNLLSNALKFTPHGGAIKFVMGIHSNDIRIVCEDNGPGIHPDDLPHVFERFYTTRRSDAPVVGGSGMGLSLVKELTDRMGGRIRLTSVWEEGTSFIIDIPLLETPEDGPGKQIWDSYSIPDPAKVAQVSGQLLLLVEDEPYFQDYMRVLLGREYEIRTAAHGGEALSLLRGGLQPALILTDLMMPEMDGYQLLDELRAEPTWQQIPVVVVSVIRDRQEEERVRAAGAKGYFSKPFDEIQLKQSLQRLILAPKAVAAANNAVVAADAADEESTESWLARLTAHIDNDMADDNFNVDTLAARMLMSRTAFYKKVQQLTGMTPNQYIMECRLQKARRIIDTQPRIPIRKLVRMIGLKHEGYFARHFTHRFGKGPTEFR